MRISFTKYPIDIVLCIIWAILLPPVTLLSTDTTVRTILGLPFILFIPGYTLIFALFPIKKGNKGINEIERIGLSFGFSIAITSLLGLTLNYLPWGIQLEPILLSLFFFTVGLGMIALYRWKRTSQDQRFIISLETSHFKSSRTVDNVLTIILALSIFVAGASIIYLIVTPQTGESFTEFYILTANRNSTNYPQNINTGGNTSIILGLVNHEYKVVNYTIEVWLIDESTIFNESAQKNETVYNHAWFMDKLTTTLNHTQITNNKSQIKKWEYNYTFSINKSGHFKLEFLLFTSFQQIYSNNTQDFGYKEDSKTDIGSIINNAYRELHLWLDVT
jgi:uncharacterized membrane protein